MIWIACPSVNGLWDGPRKKPSTFATTRAATVGEGSNEVDEDFFRLMKPQAGALLKRRARNIAVIIGVSVLYFGLRVYDNFAATGTIQIAT